MTQAGAWRLHLSPGSAAEMKPGSLAGFGSERSALCERAEAKYPARSSTFIRQRAPVGRAQCERECRVWRPVLSWALTPGAFGQTGTTSKK